MSARKSTPDLQALTANRLSDGAVVYLAADGRWIADFGDLRLAADEAAAGALLEEGARAVAAARVVGPYLIAVSRDESGLRPASLRERIRAAGPSAPVAAAIARSFP
ncbi:MAG: DUF2849 domain-containing protein [Rhodospirillaceae bacterium]|nr:DUF2849 domain-containing protein [Rhodospirillaceae bacterium]